MYAQESIKVLVVLLFSFSTAVVDRSAVPCGPPMPYGLFTSLSFFAEQRQSSGRPGRGGRGRGGMGRGGGEGRGKGKGKGKGEGKGK